MKEVLAIIRMDMIGKTKDALAESGFPSVHARKVLGRGKKPVEMVPAGDTMNFQSTTAVPPSDLAPGGHRLIPKRMLSMIVEDRDVSQVVDVVMTINSKGRQGDGKIFVMPVEDVIRVRTGESGCEAV